MGEYYKVKIRSGPKEIEVESHDKTYVEEKVKELKTFLETTKAIDATKGKKEGKTEGRRPPTLRELVGKIKPGQKQETAACVAYFIEELQPEPVAEWRIQDVNKLWPKTGIKEKPGNLSGTISQSKYFMNGENKGTYKLSNTGIEWIQVKLTANDGNR